MAAPVMPERAVRFRKNVGKRRVNFVRVGRELDSKSLTYTRDAYSSNRRFNATFAPPA
jgi:hypothetical protein